MRYQDAEKILITDVLDLMGYQYDTRQDPKNGEQRIYNAPYREDNKPSLVVTLSKNLYWDRGTGEGGNIKNFLALCSGSYKEDIKSGLLWADKFFNTHKQTLFNRPRVIKKNSTGTEKKEKTLSLETFTFIESKELFYYPLKNYVSQERGIPLDIAGKYLKEVIFHNNDLDRRFSAVGIRAGGAWAVRNYKFKGTIGDNFDITKIEHGTPGILIFSGMFDFLSYLVVQKITEPKKTVIILNSDMFINRAIEYIKKYNIRTVEFFKDNDESGVKCLHKLETTHAQIIDKSDVYKEYNDVNEWFVKTQIPK